MGLLLVVGDWVPLSPLVEAMRFMLFAALTAVDTTALGLLWRRAPLPSGLFPLTGR